MIKEIKRKRLSPIVITIIELLGEADIHGNVMVSENNSILLFSINKNSKTIFVYVWSLISYFNNGFNSDEYNKMNTIVVEAVKHTKYHDYILS